MAYSAVFSEILIVLKIKKRSLIAINNNKSNKKGCYDVLVVIFQTKTIIYLNKIVIYIICL